MVEVGHEGKKTRGHSDLNLMSRSKWSTPAVLDSLQGNIITLLINENDLVTRHRVEQRLGWNTEGQTQQTTTNQAFESKRRRS